ncbi:NAD(P)H-dependent flavin oxidoreductase [Anaerosporobacter faecicola]|uniref:NAD(P)H-dependent flavin oxidoreductase n=1 Tax=Anaerosporobacter faecicola TaxID=2718714 RepID=UPI00143AB1E9|nr:nitronate monooxygenase family protein [Anaerosporobacter faecicola]
MLMKPLLIGNLKSRFPIIQGGMGVGISRARLAGAVASEGGIGIISTAQIGYDEPDFEKHPIEANLLAIKKHLQKAKEIAKGGIVGVNIMVATKRYADYVKAAVEAKADVIISGAGLPVNLPELVRGGVSKIAPIVSSCKAASIILKLWDKKYQRTADFLVIEGPKAGGHLGFHEEELGTINEESYDQEIHKIIDVAREYEDKYKQNIPVIIGGGIYSKEDVEHALQLGAAGIQVGTRFVTTEECDASEAYKQAYLACNKEDIRIIKSPVGMPGRAIWNPFLEKVTKEKEVITRCFHCLEHCNPIDVPYCITRALIHAVEGNLDQGLIFCGENAYKLKEMSTVKEVMRDLIV